MFIAPAGKNRVAACQEHEVVEKTTILSRLSTLLTLVAIKGLGRSWLQPRLPKREADSQHAVNYLHCAEDQESIR